MDISNNHLVTYLVLLCLLAGPAQAQITGVNYAWELKRDRNDIKIYTSKVAGSLFRALRGEMKVSGSVNALVGLVDDLAACPHWADLCKQSTLIKKMSPTEHYVHVVYDIPFPVKDRDLVVHVNWAKEAQSGRVSMHSVAMPAAQSEAFVAKTKKAVRLHYAVTQWHFTPLADGMVLVENFAHIDPNGPFPAWLTNLMLVHSPFKTLQNMREVIHSGAYADAAGKLFQ
ncbi:MAG: hypothetical protein HKN85_11320 [Gammaproteobacteria bacterium]|nr:hypothetical protein [Gammaproteobacteria bacterium]